MRVRVKILIVRLFKGVLWDKERFRLILILIFEYQDQGRRFLMRSLLWSQQWFQNKGEGVRFQNINLGDLGNFFFFEATLSTFNFFTRPFWLIRIKFFTTSFTFSNHSDTFLRPRISFDRALFYLFSWVPNFLPRSLFKIKNQPQARDNPFKSSISLSLKTKINPHPPLKTL